MLAAWDEKVDYEDLTWIKNITSGKSDTFPVIGRKRDATDHVPGELILGGTVEGDEVEIFLDNIIYDSIFVADIDQMLSHFDFMGPYAKQLGESLAVTLSRRCSQMHILTSRITTPAYVGGPAPGYSFAADMKTNGASMETAFYAAAQFFAENEMDLGDKQPMLPWQQYLVLARYSGIEGGPVTTGSANRAAGTVGQIAGFKAPRGTNHIPKTNITTGPTKYQGNFTTTVGHISSDMAVGTLRRQGLKVTRSTKEDRLGTLMISSFFEGKGSLRAECAYELATATR